MVHNYGKVDMSGVEKEKNGKYIIPPLFRFNRLTVIEELGGYTRRTFKMLCDCGELKVVSLTGMIEGKTMSCGCLNSELAKVRGTTHGEDGSRLNECWKSMKARAKDRYFCAVSQSWLDFSEFRLWSINNGYDNTKVLSRYLDEGDYTPDNCKWVSKRHNITEAQSWYWAVKKPNCKVEVVYNLTDYCRVNNYSMALLSKLSSGDWTPTYRSKYFKWEVDKLMHGTENTNLWEEELEEYN